jgi:hypothetical protein
MKFLRANADTWIRSWMIVCAMFLAVELWSQSLPINSDVREVLQDHPRILGASCGVVLLITSLAWIRRNWRLAMCGVIIGALAASLAFLGFP